MSQLPSAKEPKVYIRLRSRRIDEGAAGFNCPLARDDRILLIERLQILPVLRDIDARALQHHSLQIVDADHIDPALRDIIVRPQHEPRCIPVHVLHTFHLIRVRACDLRVEIVLYGRLVVAEEQYDDRPVRFLKVSDQIAERLIGLMYYLKVLLNHI